MKMNKLSIAFATVAMATMVNASTVAWGVSSALDTEKFNAGTIYLFAGSTIADISTWAGKQESFTFDAVKTQLGADLAVLNTASGTAPNTIALSGGKGTSVGNSVTSYGTTGSTGNYSVFAVVLSEDGKNLAVADTAKTINIRAAATPANATWLAANFNTYSAKSGTDPVPEPTSGLFMLIGMAGLALRRKRA